jgi:hypothetical protein
MNVHKQKLIAELIRSQGGLPKDQFGNFLSTEDMLTWLGLDRLLSFEEQLWMKNELRAMAEAQTLMDRLRFNGR